MTIRWKLFSILLVFSLVPLGVLTLISQRGTSRMGNAISEDDKIVIKAELPGLDKKDISLDIQNGVLTLRGERKYDNEVKEENFYRREMSHGTFVRSFTLPADVDADRIKAEFKDGILTVEVPSPETRKPKQITVH